MTKLFQKGQDYYFDDNGLFVLTEEYLKKRGFCCHNNCRHCPYKEKDKKKDG